MAAQQLDTELHTEQSPFANVYKWGQRVRHPSTAHYTLTKMQVIAQWNTFKAGTQQPEAKHQIPNKTKCNLQSHISTNGQATASGAKVPLNKLKIHSLLVMRYRTHQTRVHNGRTPNVRSMLWWKTDLELCGINNVYNAARGERNAQLQSVHELRGCIIHCGSSSTAAANAKGAANAHAWTRRPRWAWPVPLLFSTLRRHPEATQELHDDSSLTLTLPAPPRGLAHGATTNHVPGGKSFEWQAASTPTVPK